MKIIMTAVMFVLMATIAYADQLEFAWNYDEADAAVIEGFRLYEDGVVVQTLPNTARSVRTPYLEDRQTHTYYATAFLGAEESAPSEVIAVDPFIKGVKRIEVGGFTVTIIED